MVGVAPSNAGRHALIDRATWLSRHVRGKTLSVTGFSADYQSAEDIIARDLNIRDAWGWELQVKRSVAKPKQQYYVLLQNVNRLSQSGQKGIILG